MKKNKSETIKFISRAALFTAAEIVLQVIGTLIPTSVNLNLSLIPITLGALFYGPVMGCYLGFVCGLLIMASPNTIMFFEISPIGTVLACLFKTGLAGLLVGFIGKWLRNKNDIAGSIIASIAVPVVNTGIFVLVSYFFFMEGLGIPDFGTLFIAFIGVNFAFEVVTNSIIAPILYKTLLPTVKRNENN